MSATTIHLLAIAAYVVMTAALACAVVFAARLWRANERRKLAFDELRKWYRRRVRDLIVQHRRRQRRAIREARKEATTGARAILREGDPAGQETHATMRPPPLCDPEPEPRDWNDDALLTEELPDIHSRRTRVMRRPPPRDE